jgi:hypothetical protein
MLPPLCAISGREQVQQIECAEARTYSMTFVGAREQRSRNFKTKRTDSLGGTLREADYCGCFFMPLVATHRRVTDHPLHEVTKREPFAWSG